LVSPFASGLFIGRRDGATSTGFSEVIAVGNLFLKFAHPIPTSVFAVEWSAHLSNMLKDVLSELESLGAVHTFRGEAFPESVKLESFVIEWPVVIHLIHLFSDLPTVHLFLTLLHGHAASEVGFLVVRREVVIVVVVTHDFVLCGSSLRWRGWRHRWW